MYNRSEWETVNRIVLSKGEVLEGFNLRGYFGEIPTSGDHGRG